MTNLKLISNKDHIRPTKVEDIVELQKAYDIAREFQAKTGNPTQWDANYPGNELLIDDIKKNQSFVFDDGQIYGGFMFLMGHDSSYDYIEDGQWLNNDEYGVIHRICSDQSHCKVLHEAIKFAKKRLMTKHGKINLRIDTHEDNKIMQHLLDKEGFEKVGIVYIYGELKRIAYHYCA